MLPALILAVLLLFVANIYYSLISKRSRARKALDQLTPALRKREHLLERFVAELPDWPLAPEVWHGLLMRSRKLIDPACSDEEKLETEPALQQELRRRFEELERDPSIARDPRFIELRSNCEEVDVELRASAIAYNERVNEFNGALAEFPGRFFAPLARLQRLGSLPLSPPA